MREETTAIFFLVIRGRMAFAVSMARFGAVLLGNACRTALGEGTGTLLDNGVSFSAFCLARCRAL